MITRLLGIILLSLFLGLLFSDIIPYRAIFDSVRSILNNDVSFQINNLRRFLTANQVFFDTIMTVSIAFVGVVFAYGANRLVKQSNKNSETSNMIAQSQLLLEQRLLLIEEDRYEREVSPRITQHITREGDKVDITFVNEGASPRAAVIVPYMKVTLNLYRSYFVDHVMYVEGGRPTEFKEISRTDFWVCNLLPDRIHFDYEKNIAKLITPDYEFSELMKTKRGEYYIHCTFDIFTTHEYSLPERLDRLDRFHMTQGDYPAKRFCEFWMNGEKSHDDLARKTTYHLEYKGCPFVFSELVEFKPDLTFDEKRNSLHGYLRKKAIDIIMN